MPMMEPMNSRSVRFAGFFSGKIYDETLFSLNKLRAEHEINSQSTLPAKVFAILDTSKQYDTGEGVEQHEQKHSHDNEETLEHGYDDGQHQHLQRCLGYTNTLDDCWIIHHTVFSCGHKCF
jgi:hypothetical protein